MNFENIVFMPMIVFIITIMNDTTANKVRDIINRCVSGAIARTKKDKTVKPFHEALLTRELVNASIFERSFSTSFGQGPVEEISRLVAADNGFVVLRQHELFVNVFKGAEDEIGRIMASLRSGEKKPNWENECKKLAAFDRGDTVVRRIISDLWMEKEGKQYFVSIKTVKPNLDQTENAKRDMLYLKAHNPNFLPFFALFYNPGGIHRENYNWKVPLKIFDMMNDPCVLIGKEYWDLLGGENTYDTILEIFTEVGMETREKILHL